MRNVVIGRCYDVAGSNVDTSNAAVGSGINISRTDAHVRNVVIGGGYDV